MGFFSSGNKKGGVIPDKFKEYWKSLKRGAGKKLLDVGGKRLAHNIKKRVEKGYKTTHITRSQGTLAAYALGKKPGVWPEKYQWHNTVPFRRSGLLIQSLELSKEGDDYVVRINPDARYTNHGDPADKRRALSVAGVAAQLEDPKEFAVTLTKKMRAYLAMLNPEAGKGMRIGDSIIIKPKPRPVWGPAAQDASRMWLKFAIFLNKHLMVQGPIRTPKDVHVKVKRR
jgi:hypothetical protein